MTERCGCCEGIEKVTPVEIENRPGLAALAYRVGTHESFLESMKAGLSEAMVDSAVLDADGSPIAVAPLRALRTRDGNDPSIAFLDAWATVADVLTFYQERIANEGYLRTATERRSLLELANLVGYIPKPGVSASVYLAYTLDPNAAKEVPIAAGARAQTIPDPGETMQTFETSEDIVARPAWNNLKPRVKRPQTEQSIRAGMRIYLKGISSNLKANDPVLIDFGNDVPEFFRVVAATPDSDNDRTLVALRLGIDKIVRSRAALGRMIKSWLNPPIAGQKATELLKKVADEIDKDPKGPYPNIEHLIAELSHILQEPDGEDREGLVDVIYHLLRTSPPPGSTVQPPPPSKLKDLITSGSPLLKMPPAPASDLTRSLADINIESGIALSLVSEFEPGLRDALPAAVASAQVTVESGITFYALRVKASPFGNNAQMRSRLVRSTEGQSEITTPTIIGEWPILEGIGTRTVAHEQESVIFLDGAYEGIQPDSWLVIDTEAVAQNGRVRVAPANREVLTSRDILVTKASDIIANGSRADYGFSSKTTRIELSDPWLKLDPDAGPKPGPEGPVVLAAVGHPNQDELQELYDRDFQVLRSTVVYAQSDELELAEEPIEDPVCAQEKVIELDGLYDGLPSGRLVIVSGERTDIPGVAGLKASEVAQVAATTNRVSTKEEGGEAAPPLEGDRTHTYLTLDRPLTYCYKRDTVTVYGNVVPATHGETRPETLGSGNAEPFQQFTLKQSPLTFVSAPTPSGVLSTLDVRVNDVRWHEADSLAGLGPADRKFISSTDDDSKTTITFGNGKSGARVPTGVENVKSVYRMGIGKPGNVKAGQISLLATRPLGVKEVTNPIRSSGGADREPRDQIRRHAPLAITALDRLVSVQDYSDFARTFAGIGKADARLVSDGVRQFVHLTVAGEDDIPIDPTSDLFVNLTRALRDYGDPHLPFQVALRELVALVISSRVRINDDYLWEKVKPAIRSALEQAFGFESRELGQSIYLSEVVQVIQGVRGVDFVDVDMLAGLSEEDVTDAEKLKQIVENPERSNSVPARLAQVDPKDASVPPKPKRILAAQLAFLMPAIPDTIVINQLEKESNH